MPVQYYWSRIIDKILMNSDKATCHSLIILNLRAGTDFIVGLTIIILILSRRTKGMNQYQGLGIWLYVLQFPLFDSDIIIYLSGVSYVWNI